MGNYMIFYICNQFRFETKSFGILIYLSNLNFATDNPQKFKSAVT